MGSQGSAVKPKNKLSVSSSASKAPQPLPTKSQPTPKGPSTPGSRTGKPDENTGKPSGGDIKKPVAAPISVPKNVTTPIPINLPKETNKGDTMIKNAKDEIARLDAERIAQEEAAKRKLAEDAAAAQAAAEAEQTTLLERQTSRGRQKAKSIAEYGRSDTILTSPLGLPSGPSAKSKKTLLGV